MAGHITQWTPARIAELRRHVRENELFMKEIADRMGLKRTAVTHKCRQLGIRTNPPGRFAEWNRKHAHLREPAMRYFMTHSAKDTAAHLGLTPREFKSLMTYGYKDERLTHLRKDLRRRDPFTKDELVFFVQHAGIRSRAWIAKKTKRGETHHPIKDYLRKFHGSSKHLNGMPWSWAQEVFGLEAFPLTIKTKTGPTSVESGHGDFRYRILPWTECERLLDAGLTRPLLGKGKPSEARRRASPRVRVSPEVQSAIRALAQFQRWIHGVSSSRGVTKRINQALRRR